MNIQDKLNKSLAKPNETIREHTNKVKQRAKELRDLNYISEEVYKKLYLSCEYHDYGKLNPLFQERIKSKKKFDKINEIGHNILSVFFLAYDYSLNNEKFGSEEDYKKIFHAVLNHHHYTDNMKELTEEQEKALLLLKDFSVGKIKRRFLSSLTEDKSIDKDILTGLLNKCDYAGSGNYPIEYKNDFLLKSLKNLKYNWNPLQEYMIKNRDENVIVVANTGMGKTEAGLLWLGDNKGFFILPLRTAINAIYTRVRNDIVKEEIEKRVILLHSEATNFLISNYLKEMTYEEIKDYTEEGKNLSLPLSISTLDQIFNFVFLYDGYEPKLATLSYSKVVIDEIQAYSPDLLAYIIIGLRMIKEAGGKFAILTATLPPFIKYYLEKEIGEEIKFEKFIQGKTRHSLRVLEGRMRSKIINEHYTEKGGKTLVICNTIKMAQKIYNELLSLGIEEDELRLFHSKFIRQDRAKKEAKIIEFGKTENYGNQIWISTSLVEASLDIDFDVIFTELNDISGLFQRLGRVNRKGKKEILGYNSYVFNEIDSKLFINGERGFIDKDIFELSKRALSEVDGELSEEKKYELIENYLTIENIKESSFHNEFKKNKEYMNNIWRGSYSKEEMAKTFRNIISYKSIPKVVYDENIDKIEELMEIYKTKEGEIRDKAKIEIDNYTLSLGIYEKGKNSSFIEIGREKIYIVEGNYSYERGFEKSKESKIKQEEIIDIFL